MSRGTRDWQRKNATSIFAWCAWVRVSSVTSAVSFTQVKTSFLFFSLKRLAASARYCASRWHRAALRQPSPTKSSPVLLQPREASRSSFWASAPSIAREDSSGSQTPRRAIRNSQYTWPRNVFFTDHPSCTYMAPSPTLKGKKNAAPHLCVLLLPRKIAKTHIPFFNLTNVHKRQDKQTWQCTKLKVGLKYS